MPIEPTEQPRSVIPRWRLSSQLSHSPEALSVLRPRSTPGGVLSDIEAISASFASTPSIGLASELLSAAIVEGDLGRGREAAAFIARSGVAGKLLLNTARRVLDGASEVVESRLIISPDVGVEKEKFSLAISAVRQRIRSGFANPLTWLDLGYLESLQGDTRAARRAVLTALKLGGGSRVIRRSAARFFVHTHEKDIALAVVDRAPGVKFDPWLLSAHIAIETARGRRSKYLGYSAKEIKRGAFGASDVSELSVALATEEFHYGALKKVKLLSRSALVSPTENALAQLAWIDGVGKLKLVEDSVVTSFENAHEARARVAYASKDWLGSCEAAWYWLADQPFSERAALFGSFVSLVLLDDPAQSIFFCVAGMRANPDNFLLANNLAVAQLLSGYIDDATATLKKAPLPDGDVEKVVWLATQGLQRFREGSPDEGRRLYDLSNDLARRAGNSQSIALNRLFLAKEEFRIGNIDAFYVCCSDMAAALKTSGSEYAAAIEKEIRQAKAMGADRRAAEKIGSVISSLVADAKKAR